MKKALKFVGILFILVTFSLAMVACSADAPAEAPATEAPAAEAPVAEAPVAEAPAAEAPVALANGVTDELLNTLKEKVQEVSVLYNEIVTLAKENGWESDELTMEELNAVYAMIVVSSEGIEDPSIWEEGQVEMMIEGFDEMVPEFAKIKERVSVKH